MDGQVVISITDDGPGMSAEVQHAIFSPYFTTKEGGTGLGLGLVQKAVQRMQGELKVSSTPGHGSSFHIELPCPVEELAGTASGIRCSFVPLEAHLLLVEDDTSLGEMIVTAMSLQGARVTFVKTAQEALALDEPFDLALLDLLLPDMRGDHLLHELRQKRMITKAILLSGDAPPKDIHPEAMPQMWLQKPFELDTLIHAIRQQLGMAELEPTGQRRRPRHG